MTLEEIQQAIAKLSQNERTRLRLWLAEFDAPPTQEAEPTNAVEKIGRLAGRTFADLRKRMREP